MDNLAARVFLFKTRRIAGPVSHRVYKLRFAGQARAKTFVGPETELCIEGFPRSANSFAYNAIAAANPQVERYGRHVHTVSQVTEAVRLGIPALLVIRPPAATVRSFLGRFSPRSATLVLGAYAAYYQAILPFVEQVTVSDFGTTTTNLAASVAALNARYGTALAGPERADQSAAAERLAEHAASGRGVAGLPPIRDGAAPQTQLPAKALAEAEAAYAAVQRFAL